MEGAPLGTRAITRLEKKRKYVYHYNFHIIDRAFRRPTVKMSRHPAFGAQVILYDHEHVAVAAQSERIGFTKEKIIHPPPASAASGAAGAAGAAETWTGGGQLKSPSRTTVIVRRAHVHPRPGRACRPCPG